MRVAAFTRRRWPDAIRAAGHTCIELPPTPNSAYFESTLEDRIEHGRRVLSILEKRPADFILDAYGDGMLFADDPRRAGMSMLVHHILNVPLVSHWPESLRILFKKMDPALVHDALQSPTWFKGVFTRTHLAEMEWLGIPGCFHLPLAADDYHYPEEPPSIDTTGPKVFFAGSQQSLYFAHGDGVDVRSQWPGGIALAATADGSASSFLDVYRRYEFGPRPAGDDTAARRAECARQYFDHKTFYAASRNLGTRDRFILFLSKEMGDDFLLAGGDRWKRMYRLPVHSRLDDSTYLDMIRKAPICLCLVNGDNDGGLNLRHFEVTANGGFMLAYNQPELAEHFEIGVECEAFGNETELLEKIKHYLECPEERNAVARAGQRKTLTKHLLHHRFESVLHRLKQEGQV